MWTTARSLYCRAPSGDAVTVNGSRSRETWNVIAQRKDWESRGRMQASSGQLEDGQPGQPASRAVSPPSLEYRAARSQGRSWPNSPPALARSPSAGHPRGGVGVEVCSGEEGVGVRSCRYSRADRGCWRSPPLGPMGFRATGPRHRSSAVTLSREGGDALPPAAVTVAIPGSPPPFPPPRSRAPLPPRMAGTAGAATTISERSPRQLSTSVRRPRISSGPLRRPRHRRLDVRACAPARLRTLAVAATVTHGRSSHRSLARTSEPTASSEGGDALSQGPGSERWESPRSRPCARSGSGVSSASS